MHVTNHDDLQDITTSNKWQQLCRLLSDMFNEHEAADGRPLSHYAGTRLALFAVQIAPIADACPDCDQLAWPHQVGQDGLCTYRCPNDSTCWTCYYAPNMLNLTTKV